MEHGAIEIPVAALLPFALMLLSIAVFPLVSHRFWNSNRNRLLVAAVLSFPVALYLIRSQLGIVLFDTLLFDYVPFIVLLGALFVISGGIFFDGVAPATPLGNVVLLGCGSVLASLLGTTGASMLMIRPLLHINRYRRYKVHTVCFFIALAGNCGGLLTPLGDPPLFMMYLRGVPFAWFLRLFPLWLFVNAVLVAMYYAVDRYFWRKETETARLESRPESVVLTMSGRLNFLWLGGVILAVALLNGNVIPLLGTNRALGFVREAAILGMAILSLLFTPHMTRVSNGFNWEPIKEVACVFLGIFVTMIPCLLYLQGHAHSLHVSTPAAFYYVTGALSSVLDNTPTAVTFHAMALGLGEGGGPLVAGIPESLMAAICAGAVFFGAMTYIGNGPNFMIKAVADQSNVRMPGFFGFVGRFALIVLLPVFILVQLLFVPAL